MIVSCLSPQQPGWLALREQMFPHHAASELLAEMATFCADRARFGQFLWQPTGGDALGFAEVSLRSDYVVGTRTSPVAFLEAIYVTPSSRHQGIARTLVAVAEDWARERGCPEFASDALIDNDASHAMHRALGFEETKRVVYFRKLVG